jgi:hypothetical protein
LRYSHFPLPWPLIHRRLLSIVHWNPSVSSFLGESAIFTS